MVFKEQLKKYQQEINEELEKYIRKEKCPEETLNQSMEYSLMAGGKRLRPILTLATYQLFKQDADKCFPYAVAIEMIHNFSLIHDDLRESNIEEIPKKVKVIEEFSKAVDRMIAGEYVDTEKQGQQITQAEQKYIHENKTSSLLSVSVRMGAILADCTELELKKMTCYADKIGLAFQIKDDILSEEGNEEILGKPIGNDKKLGKCTYISQYGLEGAKKILDKNVKEAVEELKEFGEKAEFLKQLAYYIQNRNK